MRHCVEEILATRSIDFIHADQLTMTQFAPFNGEFRSGRKRPLLVFDAHNAVWTIVQRMESNVPWFLRPILKLETKRVMLYEGEIVEKYDHTLAVTDVDRQYLLDARNIYLAQKGGGSVSVSPEGRSVTVVPIAVDTEQLQPVIRQPDPKELFTMGTLHYPPNADGIRWFAREVFPLIQEKIADIHLTIAGRNPPPDIRRLGEESGGAIKVTGFVPDLRPYLERSAAMVVPVRAGSGMRVRILEAFARAIPVVTTSVGLEGIDAKPGEDVLVADTAVDFAASVINLLDDQVQQTRLAQNGRMLAESRYDWKVILKKMDVIYGA
jgi:glycosyltransferase involved in cell wall biosynthesis